MRNILTSMLLLLTIIMMAGCDLNISIPADNPDNDSQTNLQEQLNTVLDKYKNLDYMTVTEATEAVDFNDKKLNSTRTTYVDLNGNYFHSVINCENKEGIVYKISNSFYYKLGSCSSKVNYDSSSAYGTLGFQSLFNETDFRFSDGKALINISSPFISNYLILFDNVNLDFGTDYSYNPSILRATIEFDENAIDSIEFDLSLVFGSFYKSVTRTVAFSFDKFEKKEINIQDNKYEVETADTLDTYINEMVYEFGDSIYVKSGDFDMLIDAGQYQDGANVNDMLNTYCTDKTLDVLIATHGHADHVAGFGGGALNSIDDVKLIIDYGYADSYQGYERIRDEFISGGADYYSAYDCVNMRNGASKLYTFSDDLFLEVIDTNQYLENGHILTDEESDAENDFSVVVKLMFKDNTYLFSGDLAGALGDSFTSALMAEGLKDITVYKAAHHGAISHNSNNPNLLNYLNPEICVSSAAIINTNNPFDHYVNESMVYQHPRATFVRWILNTPKISKSKRYYFNGTMGTIHISDNGKDVPNVTGLGPKRGYYMNGIKVTNENNLPFYETQMYKGYYLS
ncbi:MAG: MBL fold metallo-hydrolase [Erysipelotrichaceae bacterium]|nr:MBL fold metallo-hydrolase [Erysipelotrichaceae bacterium]